MDFASTTHRTLDSSGWNGWSKIASLLETHPAQTSSRTVLADNGYQVKGMPGFTGGGTASDTIIGENTAESLSAGNGDDVLLGNGGADILTGGGNDSLYCGDGNDTLKGGPGNDLLDGGAGADTLEGGDGNDPYNIDSTGDLVSEENADLAVAGSDTVLSLLSAYTLPANVENLHLISSGAANGTGNALDNVLIAGSGDNRLDGAAGNDTVSYLGAPAGVTVSLAVSGPQATGGSGTDALVSIENLTGSAFADQLTGDDGNNRLTGDAGNDTYRVDQSGDLVVESNADLASGGRDTVLTSLAAYTLPANVENLHLLATGAANGSGNALDNLLLASNGDNRLDGGTGSDTAAYSNATAAVTVSLAVDTAQATGGSGSDTLLAIEHLAGSNFNDSLTGNGLANTLIGGTGNDTLAGGAGSDRLLGGSGSDTYRLARGDGADTVSDNDATAGQVDVAQFAAGIAPEQLWFRRLGSHLEVSVIGTDDRLTVENWYAGPACHLERFQTADNRQLLDSQVDALVQAMAAFAPPAAGQTTLPPSYQSTLAPLLAANWQ